MRNIFTGKFCVALVLSVLLLAGLGCRGKGVDTDWRSELSGKQLLRIKELGEISDSLEIRFCASGRFTGKHQYYDVIGDGHVESGTWSVTSSTLTMDSHEDGQVQAELSSGFHSNIIKVDSHDYIVTTHNDDCSGE